MQTEPGGYTRALAELVARTRFDDLPPSVVERAKDAVLDQLGVQLLGSTLPGVEPVYRHFATADAGEATVVGRGARVSAPAAALVNATFGHAAELDDFILSGGHPGAATVPVALALAERRGTTGRDLLTAIVLGYEVMARVGAPVRVSERGFHSQSTVGVFAAAATAGKLLGYDAELLAQTLGIAGSYASGTTEYAQGGGEVKRLHAGLAARAGVEAALLAGLGLTGPTTILEGRKGFFRAFADDFDPARLTSEPPDGWAIEHRVLFKRHACVIGLHSPIDALTGLLEREPVGADQVRRIVVHVNRLTTSHGGSIQVPHDVVSAQFSLGYSLALRVVYGRNDLDLYREPRCWVDPAVVRLAQCVEAHADADAIGPRRFASHVEVHLGDGRVLYGEQDVPVGHPTRPLSPAQVREKFYRLATARLPVAGATAVSEAIGTLDSAADVRHVVSRLAPAPPAAVTTRQQ